MLRTKYEFTMSMKACNYNPDLCLSSQHFYTMVCIECILHVTFLFRFSMMQSCWEHKDTPRPTFSKIVSFLGSHLEYTSDYLDLTAAINESTSIMKVDKEESSNSSTSTIPKRDSLSLFPPLSTDYYFAS